jgi:Tol biopolymer transport system component
VAAVLDDGAANFHGALSPDGQLLAYDSDREGTRGVYIARADGSESRRVSGDGYAAAPRWSPDGRRLAFVKGEPDRARVWNVWLLELDSDRLMRISDHGGGQAWGPSWFPDSRRVAYSVEDRLVAVDIDRGNRRVWRAPAPGRLIRTPAVSPDGRWIVFQMYRDGVWLLDVHTGAMRRVLADKAAEEFAWTPDGRHVAYHSRRAGAWSLWRLPIDAAAARFTF